MAERLVELFHGRLTTHTGQGPLSVTAILPTARQIEVLAIEDNLDTLQLWQRYVQHTPYHLVGVRDPAGAMRAARETPPDVVMLDVMMPGTDGWELLGQLRNHPATSEIRIVVCTVLPQEELALSLGANAFVRKPATREEFLQALGSQTADAAHR